MSNPGGKGSTQRPTDKQAYDTNYDRIFRKKLPEGCDGSCGHPFCDCVEVCEEKKNATTLNR